MIRGFLIVALLLAGGMACAADMVSYRATYEYEPQPAAGGQRLLVMGGTQRQEVRRTCSGWVTNVQAEIRRGDGMTTNSRSSALEALDGTTLRFSRQEWVNGQLTENREGSAELSAPGGGGQATFTRPQARQIDLPAGTLFSQAHTRRQIEQGRDGLRLFDAQVFSGETNGPKRLNSVLLSAQEPRPEGRFPVLSPLRSWRIIETTFTSDTETTPAFEASARLWENGVVGDIEIRFGEQTLWRRLITLELLPDEGC